MSPMAALIHIPTFAPFTPNKHFPSILHHSSNAFVPTHRYPTIYASSIDKTRASKKVKSNAELCNDLCEFILAIGLPEGHVPSIKELSQHGRQDLANIVRRRGYKLINQLLSTPTESDENGSCNKEQLTELKERKLKDMTEGVPLSDEVPLEKTHFKSSNGENNATSFDLQDKVEKFIKSGELDSCEDCFDMSRANGRSGLNKPEDFPKYLGSGVEEALEWASESNTGQTLNGSISQSKQAVLHESENDSPRDVYLPKAGLATADYNKESDIETRKRENKSEVDQLKFMLHQKELELSQLKEQIEKEKLALSLLQTETEKEISKAQKLIAEKDTELHAAEDLISDLKEVQIQYIGDGETVQIAGSFNGWHHRITMDPQPPSSILDPYKSRNSRIWSTVLWLYPGTYEIKFVIDGHWKIDPQRETVMIGTIQNNILRVDR